MPEQFQSQWDSPPSPPVRQTQFNLDCEIRLQNNLTEIYWKDKDIPIDVFLKYDVHYYHTVNEAIQLILEDVYCLSIEADSELLRTLQDPSLFW